MRACSLGWDYFSYERNPTELNSPFYYLKMQREGSSYKAERVLPSEQDGAGPFILDFQTPVPWEINFFVYKLPSLCYTVMAAQMDSDTQWDKS